MRGLDLVEALKAKFDVSTDAQLASALGYSTVRIQQLKGQRVTERTLAGMIAKGQKQALSAASEAIAPIVEFFPIDSYEGILDTSKPDHAALRDVLSSCCGLYSFYNSELEVIYVGKTVKRNLWAEMTHVFGQREMAHYERYSVQHAHGRYSAGAKSVRKIVRTPTYLADAAGYFSAYRVPNTLVTALETLIIRMVPNDLLNVRMEGNTRLKPYTGPK